MPIEIKQLFSDGKAVFFYPDTGESITFGNLHVKTTAYNRVIFYEEKPGDVSFEIGRFVLAEGRQFTYLTDEYEIECANVPEKRSIQPYILLLPRPQSVTP